MPLSEPWCTPNMLIKTAEKMVFSPHLNKLSYSLTETGKQEEEDEEKQDVTS